MRVTINSTLTPSWDYMDLSEFAVYTDPPEVTPPPTETATPIETATPVPTVQPAPVPTVTPIPTPSAVAKPSFKLATSGKRSIKVTARCAKACPVTATLTVDAATARKLHTKRTLVTVKRTPEGGHDDVHGQGAGEGALHEGHANQSHVDGAFRYGHRTPPRDHPPLTRRALIILALLALPSVAAAQVQPPRRRPPPSPTPDPSQPPGFVFPQRGKTTVKFKVVCGQPCDVTAELTVDRPTAKKLGLGKKLVAGTLTQTGIPAGRTELTLKLKSKAKKALQKGPKTASYRARIKAKGNYAGVAARLALGTGHS